MNGAVLNIFRSGRVVGDALRRYRASALLGATSIATVDVLDALLPLVLKAIIDSIEAGNRSDLFSWCGIYFGIAFVQAIGRILWRVGFFRLGTQAGRDLRIRLLDHLMRLPLPVARKNRSGQVVATSQSDVEGVRAVLEQGMITLFDALIYLLTIPIIMLWLSPGLALVSMLLLPVIPFLVVRGEKNLKSAARRQQDAIGGMVNNCHESFSAIRLIKCFAREQSFSERFSCVSADVADHSIELARREALFLPQLEVVISLSMVALLFVGGELVLTEQLTIGTYVAFQRYLQTLLRPAQAIGLWFAQLQRAAASSERIESILEDSIPTPSQALKPPEVESAPILAVENLCYAFPGSPSPLFNQISFSLAYGERIAIVGPSGSGKSVLLELLIGARAVNETTGLMLLAGVDYRTLDIESIRRSLAYVEQAPFLFSDTVRANIAPDGDPAPVFAAVRMASIEQEILALPQGMESVIGERGVTLSGGQRQRIAIARSLVKEPAVLVWDNALSSVDLFTESQILAALTCLPRKTSMIVVTHRLSTTLQMDRILVLNHGCIEQQGTHEQLLRDEQGWYYAFCQHQKRVSELQALEEERRND